jgi:homoisocitrate dehydrogenase
LTINNQPLAISNSPPLVTIVHKANVLSLTDGLFRESVPGRGAGVPDVQVEEQIVDSMIYRMIREPERYDVVVAPNLYGDILSDAAAALVGGLGLAPAPTPATTSCWPSRCTAARPTSPGRGIANPCATILAAAQLLDSLGEDLAAQRIRAAVHRTLADGVLSADLGGGARTAEVTDAVIERLRD